MIDSFRTREEFKTAIEAMFVTLGGELSEPALFGYWMALSDFSIEEVRRACVNAMCTARFVPKPVELRESISGGPESSAMLAWGDVQRAIGLGPYKHVDFTDKIINAVILNMGGWPAFIGRLTDAESEKWLRIEFLKCYLAFANRGVSGEICKPLIGLSEQSVVAGKIVEPKVHRVICTAQPASGDNQKRLTAEE